MWDPWKLCVSEVQNSLMGYVELVDRSFSNPTAVVVRLYTKSNSRQNGLLVETPVSAITSAIVGALTSFLYLFFA